MGALQLTEEGGPRQPVRQTPGPRAITGDIVLLVDESIAANYLDLNHPLGVYSGLAKVRPGLTIANYGIAASVSNCSVGSNQALRFGGTRETYRSAVKVMPSIWAFAHRAGLRTVYLDGQRRNGALQNLMTAQERSEVGEFVQLGNTPVIERDHELARLLAERLQNQVAEFILVNKVGAHFPVADKFPLQEAVYHPLPARGQSETIIDMGPVHGSHKGTPAEWRLYRNAYRNAVQWMTGGFFDRLLPHVPGSEAVIIYTSDHGQDLHERGNPGKGTHCVNDPLIEEGAVPLVVIDGAGEGPKWKALAEANFDRVSHFRIFPSLLQLMGYSPTEIASFYGPSLMTRADDPMTFTPDYFAALGREPGWRRVVRAELATPPVTDPVRLAQTNRAMR
jgi:lipid A ethanolaminephosphotransferase